MWRFLCSKHIGNQVVVGGGGAAYKQVCSLFAVGSSCGCLNTQHTGKPRQTIPTNMHTARPSPSGVKWIATNPCERFRRWLVKWQVSGRIPRLGFSIRKERELRLINFGLPVASERAFAGKLRQLSSPYRRIWLLHGTTTTSATTETGN